MTCFELEKLTGIRSVTWSNISLGKQRPSLQTINKTARSLGWTEEKVIEAIARRQEISLISQSTFKKA